jgi:SAM-dependent methyltransferase
MEFRTIDLYKFDRGATENPRFWSRFAEVPDFTGAAVLDVGCGWGSLCVDLAKAGAQRVVGLDLKPELISFAKAYVRQRYPECAGTIEFDSLDLRDYDELAWFDYIVSKDAFEHIIELDRMLFEMDKRLKPGGRIYAGFGPLYPSPYGDHDRRRTSFKSMGLWGRLLALAPWGHLFLEPLILEMCNRSRATKVRSMHELGLNKLAASGYRRLFDESGLAIRSLRVNQHTGHISKAFALLSRIPALADYCTHNMYCILEKTPKTVC